MKQLCITARTTCKKITSIFIIITTIFSMSLHATNKWDKHIKNNEEKICAGQVLLVYIDSTVGDTPLRQTANKLKADIIYEYKYTNALALNFSGHKKKETLIKRLLKTKGVLKVIEDKTTHDTPSVLTPHQTR